MVCFLKKLLHLRWQVHRMLKWPSKNRATALTQRPHSERMSAILDDVAYALSYRSLYGAVFPTGRMHGSSNQGAEAGVAPFTIILSDTLGDLCFPPL